MVTTDRAAPSLELDWEEGLFKMIRGLVRRLRPAQANLPEHAASLEPLSRRLGVLTSLFAGRTLSVCGQAGPGGLRGDEVVMPPSLAIGERLELNVELYVLRALISGQMRRLAAPAPADPDARLVAGLALAEAAVHALVVELPGFERRFRVAAAEVIGAQLGAPTDRRAAVLEGWRHDVLTGHPLPEASVMQSILPKRGEGGRPAVLFGELFEQPEGLEGDAEVAEPEARAGRESAALRFSDVRRRLLDDDPEKQNPIVHTFEKVETLDAHAGGRRFADGSDELAEQLEALEDVQLREVVRGGPEAESVLRAHLTIEADIPDVERARPGEKGVSYDEWDVRRRRYRRGWCTVYPTPVLTEEPEIGRALAAAHRREIEGLFRRIDAHRSKPRDARRQRDGHEVDIDGAVDHHVERAAGREGDGRVYVRRTKQDRELCAALLLDVSLSTDSWVEDRRVLDVARAAAVVLGEVTERLGDRLAVYAFASKTRNVCRVFELRGFDEPWTRGRARLGALEPRGYTRIGPAIRHVSAQLAAQDARRRLLLVVSDGKPTDFDRYEGRYGIADVRRAVQEAHHQGVVAHALTIDSAARGHLPATFGPGAWHVMSRPEALPRVMAEVYGRLTAL